MELTEIRDKCVVEAIVKETKKETKLNIDLAKYPAQITAIGKMVGDEIHIGVRKTAYIVTKIYMK